MKKTAVIVHGWPQVVKPKHVLYKYLSKRGNEVIAPYLYQEKWLYSDENIIKFLKGQLGGRKPEVIVGISMGGYVVPKLARDFPQAKLIFIASTARWGPTNRLFKWFVESVALDWGWLVIEGLRNIPSGLLSWGYDFAAGVSGVGKDNKEYQYDKTRNIKLMMQSSSAKMKELARYVTQGDIRGAVPGLPNKVLIFSGEKDELMPLGLARELKDLFKNSRLVTTKGSHFNVFGKAELPYLDEFLG